MPDEEYDPTAPNTGEEGKPPPTWDPGKATQPAEEPEDEEG